MSTVHEELEVLCNRLADGLASEVDAERLGELLRAGPDVRRRYREFMDLHAALHWDYVAAVAPQPAMPRAETTPGGDSGRWKWVWLASAAVAMTVLIMMGWFAVTPRERATTELPVATLTAADGCVWEGDSLAVGADLRPGQAVRLKQGVAEIQFGQGAVLVVRGPATLDVESAQAVRLQDGAISAVVPPHAVGFTVDAPGLKVVDLGTRFGLKVSEGVAEVHVFKGRVQASLVDPQAQQQVLQTVTLSTSEAVVVELAKQKLAPITVAVEAFAFDESLSGEATEPVGPAINGGSSWEGWTALGASNQRGLYGSGSVDDVYRVYSTVFRFDRHAVSGRPVGSAGFGAGSHSRGAFADGHTVLGIGVEWVSGSRVTMPTVKFDLGNDSYAAASTVGGNDGRVDGSAHAGDFSTQFHYGEHWTPETLIVFNGNGKDELTGNMARYDYAFRCFAVCEASTNETKSYQLFFDLDAMKSLYGTGNPGVGIGRIGSDLTVVINGYGSNQAVIERLPIVLRPQSRRRDRADATRAGSKRVMTGRIPATPTATINDVPLVISILAKMRERIDLGLPNCISCTDPGNVGAHVYAQGSASHGPKYNPFGVGGDPNKPDFEIKNVTLHKGVAWRPEGDQHHDQLADAGSVRPLAGDGRAPRALRTKLVGAAGAARAAPRGGGMQLRDLRARESTPARHVLQLGQARGQSRQLRRHAAPLAAIRPSGHGAD